MAPEGASERPQTAVELKEQIEVERLGVPLLVDRDGDDVQRILAIEGERGSIWIGRSEAADVSLPVDGEVSGLHAQIEFVGSECTLLDDGISRNGTFVNEERVSGRRRLRDGDVIRAGRTRIRYRVPLEAAPQATVVADEGIGGPTAVSPAQRRVLVSLCRPFKEGTSFATPATNAEIAADLHLSIDAVKTHMRALFERFELGDVAQSGKRVALVQRAMQSGVIAERDL